MLPDLVSFEDKVTLIMSSGVQFLDFGLKLATRDLSIGEFILQDSGESLARLEYDDVKDRYFHPASPDISAKSKVSASTEDSIKLLSGTWLPIPFLRFSPPQKFAEGPMNWARCRIVQLGDGEDPDGHTHRATLAFDTRVFESRDSTSYLAPTDGDVKSGAPFRLAHRADQMGWFLDIAWINEWLREIYEENAVERLKMSADGIEDAIKNLEHQAHFLNILDLIGSSVRVPEVKILSNTRSDIYKPIPADLVLDVGNSRTCGILIEEHPQESDGLKKRYELELRNLTVPHHVYSEPFESRVEFAQASFGKEQYSVKSGRNDAFLWPTIARVGKEAVSLASRRRGTEGSTGLSSPKRYLWDEDPYEPGWRFNCAFNSNDIEPLATAAPFSNLINEVGEALHELPREERMPVFTPRYSRSSLMMFMLAEVLTQAIVQINSPAQRLKQSHSNMPRHLRRIILTVPPSMPKPERELFRRRTVQAMEVVWKALGWHAAEAEVDDDATAPWPPFPEIHVEWDEATCGQIVYLFSETQNNFGGRTDEFFELLNRPDGGADSAKNLTVASIDIGGGTTDLVITDYALDEGKGLNAFIEPTQRFRDGFKIAGDDILLDVIRKFVLPPFSQALQQHGVSDPDAFLSRLVGSEALEVREATLRQQFCLQVLIPIGLLILKRYENYDPLQVHESEVTTFEKLLEGAEPPSEDVKEFVRSAVRRVVGPSDSEFDIQQVPITINLRTLHEYFLSDRMDICRTIKSLCEVAYFYNCDVLLLTGRPSRLPGIQALFRMLLPIPPGRIVPLQDYRTGVWYPFHKQGKVDDPKTTAAVGAMLCVLGRGRLPNFFFRSDAFRAYSTVRYLGQMDDNDLIKDANVVYADVDLDDPEYELPEQAFEMRGMMRLGFRQIKSERWSGSPLYTLSFADDKVRDRVYENGEVLSVTLKNKPSAQRGAERMESFVISRIESNTGAVSPTSLRLQLNTLANVGIGETSYWMDSGSVF